MMARFQRYSHTFWLLAGLLVVASMLRIGRIDFNSLWFDEVFSHRVAVESSILDIARDGVAGDVHPPLYFMLLHVWVRLVGSSDFALRMLSALTMILTLPAYYHLGRLLFNHRTGMLALALAVVSPLEIYYGHEARQYALSIFFVAWMLAGLALALRGRKSGWWLYGAAALGGMYTHYFTVFVLAAVQLWLLVDESGRTQWRRWLATHALVGLLFAPQALIMLGQAQTVLTNFWIAEPSPAAPLATTAFLMVAGTLPRLLEPVVIILMPSILAIGALDMRRRAPTRLFQNWFMLLVVVFLPLIAVLAISLARSSIYLDRSFSMLEPALLVALAAGLAFARRPSPLPVLMALLAAIMLVGVANHMASRDRAKPPYRDVAKNLDPDFPVLHLHDSSYLPIDYYAPALRSSSTLVDLEDRSWLLPRTWEIFSVDRTNREELDAYLRAARGRLQIVIPAALDDPEIDTLAELRARGCPETVIPFEDASLLTVDLEGCQRSP